MCGRVSASPFLGVMSRRGGRIDTARRASGDLCCASRDGSRRWRPLHRAARDQARGPCACAAGCRAWAAAVDSIPAPGPAGSGCSGSCRHHSHHHRRLSAAGRCGPGSPCGSKSWCRARLHRPGRNRTWAQCSPCLTGPRPVRRRALVVRGVV